MDIRILLLPVAVLLLALVLALPVKPAVKQAGYVIAAVLAGVELLLLLTAL